MEAISNTCAPLGREINEKLGTWTWPVLVSGVNGVKMIGVPVLQHEKGAKIGPEFAATTLVLLADWNCKYQVRAMLFDTTASNTEALTAACMSVQNVLDRELLWLPCRRYIGKRILPHCWDCLNIVLYQLYYISFSYISETIITALI